MEIGNRHYSRDEIHRKVGNFKQIGEIRRYKLTEGYGKDIDAIDLETSSGLSFTVLPDRGLDISRARYRGLNLAYLTPNAETHHSYYDPAGLEWLRTFNGGLLTTCGLTYLGPPGSDNGQDLGLHGRYSTLPAHQVNTTSLWENDHYTMTVSGSVDEASLFGDKLHMERTIRTAADAKTIAIYDTITNTGFKTSPLTILYHCNFGFPLLDRNTELLCSSQSTRPHNDEGRKNFDRWNTFSDPHDAFSEHLFMHTMGADEDGYGYAALINKSLFDGIGVYVKFTVATLPLLCEWKMMGAGEYVVGIEPSNVPVANRADLRNQGLLPFIQPGESVENKVEIGVLDGENEIQSLTEHIKYTT